MLPMKAPVIPAGPYSVVVRPPELEAATITVTRVENGRVAERHQVDVGPGDTVPKVAERLAAAINAPPEPDRAVCRSAPAGHPPIADPAPKPPRSELAELFESDPYARALLEGRQAPQEPEQEQGEDEEDEGQELEQEPPRPRLERAWGPSVAPKATRKERAVLAIAELRAQATFADYEPKPRNRTECRPAGMYLDPKLGRERPFPKGHLRIWADDEPCPWASCKHSLRIDYNRETGSFKELQGVDDGEPCCALDVADAGGIILERIGDLTGVTRERIRQVEVKALLQAGVGARAQGVQRD